MTTFTLPRGTALLRVTDGGEGVPVVFQHGLGGDDAQVAGNFPSGPGLRRITLECRAQGASTPGDERPFGMAMFADDLLAVCDHLGLERFVVGGISMGAALALRLAARNPTRVRGLILARPAWGFAAAPENMRPYAEVAAGLASGDIPAAKRAFAASPTAARLATVAPDNLASLLRFFDRPEPAIVAALLADIAADGPGVSREEAAALALPTLVIGHGEDEVHTLGLARLLAETLPKAALVEIPPKGSAPTAHAAAFRAAVSEFVSGLPA